ncbi:hypothetical protein BDQ17DRAFT_1413282 [Cyathus striatus]|nr:hypothetical protein BDQ17DRAFT_1413282 [Cyathus striatus]
MIESAISTTVCAKDNAITAKDDCSVGASSREFLKNVDSAGITSTPDINPKDEHDTGALEDEDGPPTHPEEENVSITISITDTSTGNVPEDVGGDEGLENEHVVEEEDDYSEELEDYQPRVFLMPPSRN